MLRATPLPNQLYNHSFTLHSISLKFTSSPLQSCARISQVFVQMYQEHPQFKILLQCMSEKAGRPAAQQNPALAAASVSPAAAMLAMLRSPRMLNAFGEVDLLVGVNWLHGGVECSTWSGPPCQSIPAVGYLNWNGLPQTKDKVESVPLAHLNGYKRESSCFLGANYFVDTQDKANESLLNE